MQVRVEVKISVGDDPETDPFVADHQFVTLTTDNVTVAASNLAYGLVEQAYDTLVDIEEIEFDD